MNIRKNLHVHYSAELYDELAKDHLNDFDDLFVDRVETVAKEQFKEGGIRDLLDVGTGTARLLIKVARLSPFTSARCIGTDFFEDMIDLGKAAVAEQGDVDNIELQVGDAHDMQFNDNSFDLVISRSTIHHWEDPSRALAEIYRVLRPGGIAVIHEPRRNPNTEALKVSNQNRASAGVENNRLEEKYTVEEVEAFLQEADILEFSSIHAPDTGPASMGFELQIRKQITV